MKDRGKMDKKVEDIRMQSVALTDNILDLKGEGIDMRKEILDYYIDKTGMYNVSDTSWVNELEQDKLVRQIKEILPKVGCSCFIPHDELHPLLTCECPSGSGEYFKIEKVSDRKILIHHDVSEEVNLNGLVDIQGDILKAINELRACEVGNEG